MGTARRTESQISEITPGIVKEIETGRKSPDNRAEELRAKKGHCFGCDSESAKARGIMRHDAADGSIRNAMTVRRGIEV